MKNVLFHGLLLLFTACSSFEAQAQTDALPKASIVLVKSTPLAKIHTLVSPGNNFANTSTVVELKNQLIVIDGQFFAQYGRELKAFTDSLGKPVTRFYISHDHPDHYIGFGDAFPNVPVYALKETMKAIVKEGQNVLLERQRQMGPLIAYRLNKPTHLVSPGMETIDGVNFVFEKSTGNEAATSLIIKLPQLCVYVAQDIVYNQVHLFISGPTQGWKNALLKIKHERNYDIIVPGHGMPGGRALLDENLAYLNQVDQVLKSSASKEEYKAKLLQAYPKYAAPILMDIYLPFLYPSKTGG